MEDNKLQEMVDKMLGCRQGVDEGKKTNKMYGFLLDKAIQNMDKAHRVALGLETSEKESDNWACVPTIKYHEEICDDYNVEIHYDSEEHSYIYRIAVMSIIDGNKSDWADFYVGIQRSKDDNFGNYQFIGKMSFMDGENTDIERSIDRIRNCMKECWW